MYRKIIIPITIILGTIINCEAQETSPAWGAKAGANSATFWNRMELDGQPGFDYSAKTGFFLGGFVNYSISDKIALQPELLFSYRNTKIQTGIIYTNDPTGPNDSHYIATLRESTLDLPVMLRYSLFRSLFLEAGPQLGYILNRKEEVEENPYGPYDPEATITDRFDAGFAAGLGVNLSSNLTINARYFSGLLKRENMISSSVLNLGMEYKF